MRNLVDIGSMTMEITHKCNRGCSYCFNNSNEHSTIELPLPTIRCLIDSANQLGIPNLYISGGEPLMHNHITEVLGMLSLYHGEKTIITTGGNHFNDYIISLISKDRYKSFGIYSLIKEIEKSNFYLYVIDCTINGRFPVIGVLLMNPLQTRYLFSLGSDPSLEISIQRCITEIFQGRKLDMQIEKRMIEICGNKQLNFERAHHEHILFPLYVELKKANANKTGCISLSNFKCFNTDENNLQVFHDDIISNKQTLELMYGLAKKEFGPLYVHDYTKSKIYTFRIYCPGVTEFIKIDKNSLNNLKNERKLLTCLRHLAENTLDEHEYQIALDLLESSFSSLSCDPLPVIYGIPASDYSKYLLDINYLLSYLYYYKGNYATAYDFLMQVQTPVPNKAITHLKKILKLRSEEIDTSFFEGISEIPFQYNTSMIPRCPDCENCKRTNRCSRHEWGGIYLILSQFKEIPDRENYDQQMQMLKYLVEGIGI